MSAKAKPAAETAAQKPKPRKRKANPNRVPRLRIRIGEGLVLGPGKVDLLETIDRTGSISAAGREMGMSYRRAWLLVDALNHMFAEPLVVASPGGASGGGASVTDYGRAVAAAYRRAEDRTQAIIEEELGTLPQSAKD